MVLAAGNTASLRQQEEDLLYSGLCMLNLTQADGGKNVDISKGMFRKPNPRAFELVLYHTFCVVKGKTAAKKVCGCRPTPPKRVLAPRHACSSIYR